MTMKIENPNPECKQECKFTKGPEFKTAAYYEPLYNKEGHLISKDANTTSGSLDCVVCGKHWTFISAHGKVQYTEWPHLQK